MHPGDTPLVGYVDRYVGTGCAMERVGTISLLFAVCLALAACEGSNGGGGQSGDTGAGGTGGAAGEPGDGGQGGAGGGGAGGAGGVGGGPKPQGIKGTVLLREGTPAHGALVALNHDFAHSRPTGADGGFAFEEVERPYRLTVVRDGILLEVEGLTTDDPVLSLGGTPTAARYATLTGTVIGPAFPLPSNQIVYVSAADAPYASGAAKNDNGFFMTQVGWLDHLDERSVGLVSLHLQREAPCFWTLLGTGRLGPIRLRAAAEVDELSLPHEERRIETAEVTVEFDPGAYAESTMAHLVALHVEGARFRVDCDLQAWGRPVPLPPEGATVSLEGMDEEGNYARTIRRILPGDGPLSLPEAPRIRAIVPQAGATVSATPVFRWAPPERATLQVVEIAGIARFVLPGGADRLALPDLSELGFSLSPGESYPWTVTAFTSPASSDGYLRGEALGGEAGHALHLPAAEAEIVRSRERSFRVAETTR